MCHLKASRTFSLDLGYLRTANTYSHDAYFTCFLFLDCPFKVKLKCVQVLQFLEAKNKGVLNIHLNK